MDFVKDKYERYIEGLNECKGSSPIDVNFDYYPNRKERIEKYIKETKQYSDCK